MLYKSASTGYVMRDNDALVITVTDKQIGDCLS